MIKKAVIDQYDLFGLIGLKKLSPEQKEKRLQQLENLIIEEFFIRLFLDLDNKDIVQINLMLKEKRNLRNVLSYIAKNYPSFYEKFIDFIREKKAEFVVDFYQNGIKNCKEMIDLALRNNVSEKNKIDLKERFDFYIQTHKLAEEESWEELLFLIKSFDCAS